MSKVISFRLDEFNPCEAQALSILNNWLEMDYGLRFVITEALLNLDVATKKNEDLAETFRLESISAQIDQIYEIVKELKIGRII